MADQDKPASGREDPRFREISSGQEYLNADLARTHDFTRSAAAAAIDPALIDEQQARLHEDGFIILEHLITAARVSANLRRAAAAAARCARRSTRRPGSPVPRAR